MISLWLVGLLSIRDVMHDTTKEVSTTPEAKQITSLYEGSKPEVMFFHFKNSRPK